MAYQPNLLLLEGDPKIPQLLKAAGFEVETARRADEAIASLQRHRSKFDAILANASLWASATAAGVELVRASVDIPVFLLTTKSERTHAARQQLERDLLTKMLLAAFEAAVDVALLQPGLHSSSNLLNAGSWGRRTRIRETANSVSATEAKNQFAVMLDTAVQRGPVVITKHDAPRAILIDVEEYKVLTSRPHHRLTALSDRFDAMLERMQGADARASMQSAFDASVDDIVEAAVDKAARRG